MRRIRPPKTGRLANPDEQEIARQWVRLYRNAKKFPDGKICLNPEEKPEIREWFDCSNPEPLLQLLENFASYGTFKDVGEETAARERFMFFVRYQFARQSGESHSSIVAKLAGELGLAERSVERHLSDSTPSKIRDWIALRTGNERHDDKP